MEFANVIRIEALDLATSNAAVEILLRAFHEDPTCKFVFCIHSAKYQTRLRQFFELGNRDHFSCQQPAVGIFRNSNLIGAAYIRTPNGTITNWNLLKWLMTTREVGCIYRLLRYLIGAKLRAPKGKNYAVVLIGIEPGHQGKGYGRSLMRAIHELCDKEIDVTGIALDTGNPRNVKFYEALGYREFSSFRLGDVTQVIMFRGRAQGLVGELGLTDRGMVTPGESPLHRSREHSLPRDITFQATADAPADFVPLVESIRWGTEEVLYRMKHCQATLDGLPPHLHLVLRRGEQLVATRIAVRKAFSIGGELTEGFYHSFFAVDPSEQGKGYGALLARHTLTHLAQELGQKGLIYAYVERENWRSSRIATKLGYRTFGHFYAHPISRLFPRDSSRVRPVTKENEALVRQLLKNRYAGHLLTDFDISLRPLNYWVLHEDGGPVAGVQLSQQWWQIEKLPGLTGGLALQVIPRLPILRDLFNPRAWHFLKIGNIFFPEGRSSLFFELVEALLYRLRMKTAAIYIDHRSPIYKELNSSQCFGLLNPLMQTKVNVWGYFHELSSAQISHLHESPLAISPIDI